MDMVFREDYIKYGIFMYRSSNLGDNIQTQTLEYVYERMGIARENVVYLSIDNVMDVVEGGFHYILPLVGGDATYIEFIECVLEHRLEALFSFVPLSIGITRYVFVHEGVLSKFRRAINEMLAPIGFRDSDSAEMYQRIGYKTYAAGCITNILPRRAVQQQSQAYIVDVPNEFLDFIPGRIRESAVLLTQDIDARIPAEEQYRMATERINLLRETASLVITGRYHIAVPCFAMGIPVVMVENESRFYNADIDARFSELNPLLPFYRKEAWKEIDWNPPAAEYEEIKRTMFEMAALRIRSAAEKKILESKISDFFLPSRKRFYPAFRQNRCRIDGSVFRKYLDETVLDKIPEDFKFYLYGLSEKYIKYANCVLLDHITKEYTRAGFLGFVDKKKAGGYISGEKCLLRMIWS